MWRLLGLYAGGARYSLARRRAGNNASVVGESKDKVEEAGGDSLEEKVVEKKSYKKEKLWKKKPLYRPKS